TQYSGSNKRKLSIAISLIGNPSIIFMDEPTTGMDARAKRFLWNCILTLTRKDHKSVVITSDSMEECETLCDQRIPNVDVREEYYKMIHFRVSTNIRLYKIFSILEKAREKLGNIIEDYTVTQITLDDVFVNSAKIQEENQILEQININNNNNSLKKNFLYEFFFRKNKNIIESTKF
ncbi:unnamed protein product, partial [Rotaria sordida]